MAATDAGKAPPMMNKNARAKLAKGTINVIIPHILKTNERARNGVSASQLVHYDPSLVPKRRERSPLPAASVPTISKDSSEASPVVTVAATAAPPSTPPKIRILKSDTFDAAHALLGPKRRVAVLNMASPLRPGGGVLNGALAQEESLCMRSTLYASLREEWYRIPEDAVGWSPDVCVFRSSDGGESELAKKDWWFVAVVSCAALRFPETMEDGKGTAYANEGQREAMTRKVRTILQVAIVNGVTHLVLGALGCGAYGNPPGEVARIFKRVICGDRRRRGLSVEGSGIEEIVFAIFDEGANLRTFREVFADVDVNARLEIGGENGDEMVIGMSEGKKQE